MSDTKTLTARSSDRHLAASIGRNTLFGVVSSAAQIGTRLVTVPIVIHHLGLGGYGIWSIIIVTAAYMRFGSAGIKSAFQKYVAEATGNGDFQTANKLVSTGSFTMLALSLTTLIPVALLSHKSFFPQRRPPLRSLRVSTRSPTSEQHSRRLSWAGIASTSPGSTAPS